jgi:chemotaxis family two-component system response regulator Rcp1
MTMAQASTPFEILLVEDNAADVRLTEEALHEAKVPHRLQIAADGVEAMKILREPGVRRPDLILLDLNLPKKDGREVLEEMKDDETLRHIPVVVLTTSEADQDIMRCYQLRANAFVTKPADLEQFFRVVKSIDDFWLGAVKLWRS